MREPTPLATRHRDVLHRVVQDGCLRPHGFVGNCLCCFQAFGCGGIRVRVRVEFESLHQGILSYFANRGKIDNLLRLQFCWAAVVKMVALPVRSWRFFPLRDRRPNNNKIGSVTTTEDISGEHCPAAKHMCDCVNGLKALLCPSAETTGEVSRPQTEVLR